MRQISRFFFSSETFVKDDYRSASDTEVYRLSTGKTPLQIFSYLFQSNQSALFCGVQQQAASESSLKVTTLIKTDKYTISCL